MHVDKAGMDNSASAVDYVPRLWQWHLTGSDAVYPSVVVDDDGARPEPQRPGCAVDGPCIGESFHDLILLNRLEL